MRRAQGNPLLLRELVQAALQRSALVRRDTVWVLDGQPPLSGGVRDLVAARLADVGEAERASLEMVASGEPLPADVALAMAGESLLISLEESRLVIVRPGLAGAEVSTAHPLYGEVLRADLPVALRLRRLRLALANALETADHPSPHDLVRAASWRLGSGQADDPQRLLAAARAARGISLATAERLARHAHQTHQVRSRPRCCSPRYSLTPAAVMTRPRCWPSAGSLTPSDREALTCCAAVGQGLMTGDTSGGAELVAALATGDPAASSYLHALHASMLTFDARLRDGLAIGLPIMTDEAQSPQTRTMAALAAVGAEYWLGRTGEALARADVMAAVTTTPQARQAVPYGAASIELIAVCALLEQGDLDAAEQRSQRMRREGAARHDPFGGPRGEYFLGRVALAHGKADTAVRRFRRCLAAVSPFDQFIVRHLNSILARAAATVGDLGTAASALQAGPASRG